MILELLIYVNNSNRSCFVGFVAPGTPHRLHRRRVDSSASGGGGGAFLNAGFQKERRFNADAAISIRLTQI